MGIIDNKSLSKSLTHAINLRVDIAGEWVSEETEADMIGPVVEMITPYIPALLRPILIDAEDGLDDEEIKVHQARLLDVIRSRVENDASDAPWYAKAVLSTYIMKIASVAVYVLMEFAQRGAAISLPE